MNIIQVGTNSGNDHVLKLCKKITPERINRLILVEPFDVHNELILINYNLFNFELLNVAIVPNNNLDKTIQFYHHNDDKFGRNDGTISFEVASINKDHIIKHYGDTIEKINIINVKTLTINELFELKNIIEIDFLFLDIEGIDFDVALSLDLSKYSIKNIIIEVLHLDKDALITYFKKYDYYPVNDDDQNEFNINYMQSGWDVLFNKTGKFPKI